MRTLAGRAIEQDLLAPDTLLEAPEPEAPPGYELVRHLGRGGCGDVYLSTDTARAASIEASCCWQEEQGDRGTAWPEREDC